MPAGVDANGLTIKTVEDIKREIEEDLLSNLDPTLVTDASQPIGQINAAFSKKAAELWELAQVAYNGFNRDASEGTQLDNVGALTGTPRDAARKTRVKCTLSLGASFSQPAGALMAHVDGNEELQFVNSDEVTSTSAGDYEAWFEATVDGPIFVNAGTLTQITNGVSGWNSVTNENDGIVGANIEEDEDYRIRQVDELFAGGSSTVDAIRVDLLEVPGVQQAFVYENVKMATDANGVPAKAIECVIFDGIVPGADNDAIAQAIWDGKPSGSETFGEIAANAIDQEGVVRVVYFTRSTVKPVYLEYDVKIDAARFPPNGAALIKEAAVKKGDDRKVDDDVIALALRAAPLEPVVRGVVDVVALRLGFAASPVGTTNLAISIREIADFDTSRIVVNFVS